MEESGKLNGKTKDNNPSIDAADTGAKQDSKAPNLNGNNSENNKEPETETSNQSEKADGPASKNKAVSGDRAKKEDSVKKVIEPVGESKDNENNIDSFDETVNDSENSESSAKSSKKKRKADEMKSEDENANEENKEDISKQKVETSKHDVDISMSGIETLGKGKRARIPNKRYSDIILSPNHRRKSVDIPPPDTEIKQDEITLKEDPDRSLSRSSTDSPSLPPTKKLKTSHIDIFDPKYHKPFKYGWRRELVWRSTSSDGKRIGDVYYFTPSGKKVRSSRELAENLKNRELTLDNFTFFKESLGLDDPEKEIIRYAKVKSGTVVTPVRKPVPKKVVTDEKPSTSKVDSPPVVVDSPKVIVDGDKSAISTNTSSPSVKTKTPSKKSVFKPKGPTINCKVCKIGIHNNTISIQCTNCAEWLHKKCSGLSNDAFNKIAAAIKKNGLRWVCHVCEDEVKTPVKKDRKQVVKTEEEMEVDVLPLKSTPNRKTPKVTPKPTPNSASKPKKRNLKLSSITNANSANTEEKNETKFMENYLQNLSFGYNTLLYVFQYLKVQDLLRAGCVCTMWRDIASHPILWRTVRMKNSQVHSFEGLANTLKKHGTSHLDLRKMLLLRDDIWPEFSSTIARVDTLRKIELCRCPAVVVEQLAVSNPNLEVINAVTIKCEQMDLDPLKSLKKIKELRLKSTAGLTISSLDSLKELKTLRHLSLTSVNHLHKLNLNVIAELTNLESLDLGECVDFPKNFGEDILTQLEKLEKLRLEKGQGNCHIFEMLEAVKNMKNLEQLELVNFDVKPGFDKALGSCHNVKKLMIIPTYISQSATTNHMVLAGVLRLQGSLSHFVWGVTLELLRVTELFVDQCEEPKEKKEKKITGNGDSIPVLKPVPDLTQSNVIAAASNPPQVEILPLPSLQKLLLNSLPTTRVKILKIPFHATWRQTLTDSV